MENAIQAREARSISTLIIGSENSVPLGRKRFKLQIVDTTPGKPESGTACIYLWAKDMKEALETAAGFIPHGATPSPANAKTHKK